MTHITKLMAEKPLVPDASSPNEEEHDLPYYLNKFSSTPVIVIKKKIVKQLLTSFPDAKFTKWTDELSTLSDQYRFLNYVMESKEKINFIERLNFYNKLTALKSKISKEANALFKAITTNDRKGKKFDGLVFAKIGPLLNKNDSILLSEVIEKLTGLTDAVTLKKLHANFIGDLKNAIDIVQKIKNEGISEPNLEKALFEKQDKLLKPGMRTLFQNVIFLDKNLLNYREPIQNILSKLTREEAERNKVADKQLLENLSLTELSRIQDVNNFVNKASSLVSKEEQNLPQVTALFDLLLNKPLINILKLLKFPLHRELFRSWFKEAPIPATHAKEVEKQMELVNIEFGQIMRQQKAPQDEAELLTLLYDLDINFTDKYNLLEEAKQRFPKIEALTFFLSQIKTTQYRIEHKLIDSIITQLKTCYTMAEIDNLFTSEREKFKKRLLSYKQALEKNLTQIFNNVNAEAQKILQLIVLEVKEEKIIPTSLILDLHKALKSGSQTLFVAKLINFLLCYYLYIFGKWILAYWYSYFSHLKTTDGLFIKNKLSSVSKEEIFNFCRTYAKNRELIKSTLLKFLQWGKLEKQAREHCLAELKCTQKVPQLTKGHFQLQVIKYTSQYTIIIKDAEGKIRLKKTAGHIVNFLDFLNIIHLHKIDSQLKIDETELKILYQCAHLSYLDELEAYIQDRLNVLTDPLSIYTSEQIREEYHKAPDPHFYLAELRKKGKAEIQLRVNIIKKLNDELFQTDVSMVARLTRIKKEIAGQQALINFKINGLLNYIDKLEQKKLADAVEEQQLAPSVKANVELITTKLQNLDPEKQAVIFAQELDKIKDEEDKVKTAADFMVHESSEPIIRKSLEIIKKSSLDKYKILVTLYKIFDQQKDVYVKLKIIEEFCQKLYERDPDTYLELKYYLDIQRKNLLHEIAFRNTNLIKIWNDLLNFKDNKEKIAYLEGLLEQPAYKKLTQQIKCIIHSFLTDDIQEIIETNTSLPAEDQLYLIGKLGYLEAETDLSAELAQMIDEQYTDLEANVMLKELPEEEIISDQSFDLLVQPENDPVQLNKQLTADFKAAEKNIITHYRATVVATEKQIPNMKKLVPRPAKTIPQAIVTPEKKPEQAVPPPKPTITVHKEKPTTEMKPNVSATDDFSELDESPSSPPTVTSDLRDLNGLQEEQIQLDDEGELDESENITEADITNLDQAAIILAETKNEEDEQIFLKLEEKFKNNQIPEILEIIKNDIVLEQAKQKNYLKMSRLLTTLKTRDFINSQREVKEQVEQYLKTMEPVIIETAKNEIKNKQVVMTTQQLTKRTSHQAEAIADKASPKVEQFIDQFKSLDNFTNLKTLLVKENFNQAEAQECLLAISKTMLSGNYIFLKDSNMLLGCGKLANLINTALEQKLKGQNPTSDLELLKDAWNFIRNHSGRFNQFQMLGCRDQEERKDLLIKLQQLTTGKTPTERFTPRNIKVLKPLRQKKRHDDNIQSSLEASAEAEEQAEHEKPTRTFEASEDKLDFAREDIQKMRTFVQESYTPIINEWITNMFKNKSREDFMVITDGKKAYYTKMMLKAVIQEMLKRDVKGKAHMPLLNTLQQDDKLFDVLIKELFDKEQTQKGYFVYFPKCLKTK